MSGERRRRVRDALIGLVLAAGILASAAVAGGATPPPTIPETGRTP